MTKILLIQPQSNIMYNRRESKPALPPYGLACIAGYLRANGHEVRIFDCIAEGYDNEEYLEYSYGELSYISEYDIPDTSSESIYIEYGADRQDIFTVMDEFEPDVVGVSCLMSLRHFHACMTIKDIKYYNPKVITVIGGNHPSAMPDLVLKECGDALDHLVIGEGEIAMLKIANGATDKIIYGEPVDLDSAPVPAHDLLPLEKYKEIWDQSQYHFYPAVKYTIINTSRGCANGCEHCPHEVVFGKGWRKRSLAKIEEEILFVKSLGVEEVQIHEYNGFMSKTFMRQVAAIMKRHSMRWNVPIGVWIKQLDEDYIMMLKKSGMNCIDLAIESINKEVLTTMPGKDVDIYHAEDVVDWCKKAGLYINAFFMIGFENQTLMDMWETVKYAISLQIDTAVFFIAQPLPGTKLWDKAKFIGGFHPFMLRYGKCNTTSELWNPSDVEFIRHTGRKMFLDYKGNVKLRGGNFAK